MQGSYLAGAINPSRGELDARCVTASRSVCVLCILQHRDDKIYSQTAWNLALQTTVYKNDISSDKW